jgi:hypothetical protein
MKTSSKRILAGAVILAVVAVVYPHTAWAGGSKMGSNRVQVVRKTKMPHTATQRVVNVRIAKGPSGQAVIGSATSGVGTGKIKFNEFTSKKPTDTASPALFKSCVSGVHYNSATIVLRKAGGDPKGSGKPFLQTKTLAAAGNDGPKESLNIDYKKIEWRY